jgi:hypothetical protein
MVNDPSGPDFLLGDQSPHVLRNFFRTVGIGVAKNDENEPKVRVKFDLIRDTSEPAAMSHDSHATQR